MVSLQESTKIPVIHQNGSGQELTNKKSWWRRHGLKLLIAFLIELVIFVFLARFIMTEKAVPIVSSTSTFRPTEANCPTSCAIHTHHPSVDLLLTNISSLALGLSQCRYSSTDLVRWYLARIDAVNRRGSHPLYAVIETNPDALTIAASLDRERQRTGPRSLLHGIPILIKDNIATNDQMETTAGSLALIGSRLGRDAHVVHLLRQAGAIILGKASLSEWANFRSTNKTREGWSARGGPASSAYVAKGDPSGSSSGSAIAVSAGLCAASLGTETAGSIVSPAYFASIVGLKPTVGLISRSGVIPISRFHDTVGPMGQTTEDIALLLGVLQGVDQRDNFTQQNFTSIPSNYTQFLRGIEGLRGIRLGVVRVGTSISDEINVTLNQSIALMREHGATIIDSVDLLGRDQYEKMDAHWLLLLDAFREDIDTYLQQLTNTTITSLQDLIDFNSNHAAEEFHADFAPNQLLFEISANRTQLSSSYQEDLFNKTRQWGGEFGIDATLKQHQLDALIVATTYHLLTLMASAAGYPLITVPLGYRQINGEPYGLMIVGTAWSEPVLLRVAHGFEQLSHVRHQRRPLFAEPSL